MNRSFAVVFFQAEEVLEKSYKQVSEIIPKQVDRLVEELKSKDPEIAEKAKRLRAEFATLKEDLVKLFDELKKPVVNKYNEVKDEFLAKTRPIIKRWTPIVKDIEVSFPRRGVFKLALFARARFSITVFKYFFFRTSS